jgi:hypothetical protein
MQSLLNGSICRKFVLRMRPDKIGKKGGSVQKIEDE